MQTPHKDFYETAYRTGSDIWSKAPFHPHIAPLLAEFPEGAMVLDVGAGRGKFAFHMVEEHGFRVIGLDIAENIVEKCNSEAQLRGLQGSIRFIEGDATDIEFQDGSFDAVTDFQLLQHIPESQWEKYVREIARILKPDGYYLNVSLSKKTVRFGPLYPKKSKEHAFEIDGIPYHFFTKPELNSHFQNDFSVVMQEEKVLAEFDTTAFIFTLFQKTSEKKQDPHSVVE